MKVKSYIQGLKWAGLKSFLFEIATINNLEFRIIDRDSGLLRETIYFEFEGTDKDIKNACESIDKSVSEYNTET